MKKLLTLLLTLLMVFTLVGCSSTKEEEPVVVDTPEINEHVQEEIVGGFIDVEDGNLTDELKAIFNKALDGLTGATYEPVELIATQVVAGTNYKFLANGTKTTNPVTKGTYYVTVYEDLSGNVSLLDIETIDEKQDSIVDPTQLSYWVVFYDQYGNEMQRTIEKYGTVPEYKTWLPEGFDKWVYKKTGEDVTTFKPITTNTYFKAVCHEVSHSSSESSSDPTPTPTPTGVCPYIGKQLGYISSEDDNVFYIDFYEYKNGGYVHLFTGFKLKSLPRMKSYKVGDWFHEEGSLFERCEHNGDGADIPSPAPIPACPHIGEQLCYIASEYNAEYYYVLCYQYNNGAYKQDITLLMPKSQLSSYSIGDWFHYHGMSVLGKCEYNGDGAVIPDCLYDKAFYLYYIYGEDANNWKAYRYRYNSTSSKFVQDDQAFDIMVAKTTFGNLNVSIGSWVHYDFVNSVTLGLCTNDGDGAEPACLAAGTMITMADGSRKPVESLQEGDDIRVFDHNTGKLSHAKIMDYWQYEEPKYGKMTLHFTNNIDVNIVGAHSFFNKQENKYVTLTSENVNDYIGKQFYNADSECWETLLGVTYSSEPVDTFFIATEDQFDCIAEGMLTMEDGIYTLVADIFDYDANMKVNVFKKYLDILRYGLFTSKDLPIAKEKAIKAYKLQYIKVAIGKGIITKDIWDMMVKEIITYESDNINEEYIPSNQKHSAK